MAPPSTAPAPRSAALPRGLRLPEMLTLSDQTDATGRLLLEDSAPKRAQKNVQRAGVRMKSVPSPYKDTPSRQGGLINVAAYEALRRDTADVLDGFAWLRRRHLAAQPARRGTVKALLDVSYLGLNLPIVLLRRADGPVPAHGRLPSYVASLYKASRGVFSAAVDLLNRKGPDQAISAAEVVTFADAEGHLRRAQTGRACAAPTRLIERTLAVVLGEDEADPDRSRLGDVVDFETLSAFSSVQELFSQTLSEYGYVLGRLTENDSFSDRGELLGATVEAGGRRRNFGEYTDTVLGHVNTAQGRLNQILGRAADAAPIGFEDLVRLL